MLRLCAYQTARLAGLIRASPNHLLPAGFPWLRKALSKVSFRCDIRLPEGMNSLSRRGNPRVERFSSCFKFDRFTRELDPRFRDTWVCARRQHFDVVVIHAARFATVPAGGARYHVDLVLSFKVPVPSSTDVVHSLTPCADPYRTCASNRGALTHCPCSSGPGTSDRHSTSPGGRRRPSRFNQSPASFTTQ